MNNATLSFIKSIYKPTYSLDKVQFMTSVKILQVLALGCRPQGIFYNKVIQVQRANRGIALPSLNEKGLILIFY
jgi:hypothetical protein